MSACVRASGGLCHHKPTVHAQRAAVHMWRACAFVALNAKLHAMGILDIWATFRWWRNRKAGAACADFNGTGT